MRWKNDDTKFNENPSSDIWGKTHTHTHAYISSQEKKRQQHKTLMPEMFIKIRT